MTCIVGLAHEGQVYIGADSAAIDGWMIRQTGWSKIVRRDPFLFAGTGSFRAIQALKHFLEVRAQEPEETDEHYLVVGLSEAIRKCFKEHGMSKVDSNAESQNDFAALIGFHGGLYTIEGGMNFQIIHLKSPYDANGSGQHFALGSLYSSEGKPPRDRVLLALETAAHFNIGVCGPFEVEVLE